MRTVCARGGLAAAVMLGLRLVPDAGYAEPCSCHYGVEITQPVEPGAEMQCTVKAVVTVGQGQPVEYPMSKGKEEDLGVFSANTPPRVEFVVEVSDVDDNVCEPGENDAPAKVAAVDGHPPTVEIRKTDNRDLEIDRDRSDPMWEFVGVWKNEWTPPGAGTPAGGVYEFHFKGKVEDLHGDHDNSNDSPDVNLAGYKAVLSILHLEILEPKWTPEYPGDFRDVSFTFDDRSPGVCRIDAKGRHVVCQRVCTRSLSFSSSKAFKEA